VGVWFAYGLKNPHIATARNRHHAFYTFQPLAEWPQPYNTRKGKAAGAFLCAFLTARPPWDLRPT